ncbi:MAG: alpha/beta hydrolase [Deltaproteobacteria bacterium]|nr:alpha/beta hydrolase [Deltaproteobacteria bacterium]
MQSLISHSEYKIPTPGGELYAKSWKPLNLSSSDPLILLHDSLGCVDLWRDFPNLLSEKIKREVIAYDRLGFGRSSKREGLPSFQFIQEECEIYLPFLLDFFKIQHFSLLGHSVGGAMAIVAAGRFGERCKSIITESAQTFIEERTRQGILSAKKDFENPTFFSKLEKYHGDKARWVLEAWTEIWLSHSFASWNLDTHLASLKCPTLAIHGDQDEYGSIEFPKKIALLAAGAVQTEILSNCGHVPHRENVEQVLSLINDFFHVKLIE